ncbi:MAG: carbohydrate ABC transporter permease [Armatimonadetes bacterium]|nr:carbohydrate ABC transporter permease [Armatimonadota bacterium]
MTRQLMWGKLLTYLALALGAAGMMLPLLWMISTSLKPPGATMTYPPEFLPRSQELFTDPRTGRKLPVFWAEIGGKRVKVVRLRLTKGAAVVRVLGPEGLLPRTYTVPLWHRQGTRRVPGLTPVKHLDVRWHNYPAAWHAMTLDRPWMAVDVDGIHFPGIKLRDAFLAFYLNSTLVTLAVTLGCLLTSSLAGFAFARLRFPGRDALFLGYLATMMVPHVVTMIPVFILLRHLHLIDTYSALILPAIFSAYGTFMLRQFFLSVPRDLEDAARLDGCGDWGVYRHVVLPLSKPALAALGTFVFLWTWNSFMWPLIVINSTEKMPLMLGLYAFMGPHSAEWHLLMAASVMVMAPVILVFLLGQKYFVQGIMLTGLKG